MLARWRRRPRQRAALAILALVAAAVAFTGYLTVKNRWAEARFRALRAEDSDAYLDVLRRLEGFDAYLDAWRRIEGAGSFDDQAPPFLIGRWTVQGDAVRRPPSGSFAACDQPLVIEYGRIAMAPAPAVAGDAAYRLTEDGALQVRTDSHGIITIRIVAHGTRIDHLELTPPGHETRMFAYPCRA